MFEHKVYSVWHKTNKQIFLKILFNTIKEVMFRKDVKQIQPIFFWLLGSQMYSVFCKIISQGVLKSLFSKIK